MAMGCAERRGGAPIAGLTTSAAELAPLSAIATRWIAAPLHDLYGNGG